MFYYRECFAELKTLGWLPLIREKMEVEVIKKEFYFLA